MIIESKDNYHLSASVELTDNLIEPAGSMQHLMAEASEKLAAQHQFFQQETFYFYLFNHSTEEVIFNLECDVLEVTKDKVAIECYLYAKHVNSFFAKSFAVFK